jgi:peptidoglycan/LPS O-acetylase OafA/YrhL
LIDVYRFILALCVVQGHFLGWARGAPWLAWQAVFSFYVVSGFLMSLVLNQDYGFMPSGLVRFAVNRWLRLFPIYYAVIGLTVLYIAFVGPLSQLNHVMTLPSTGTAIFGNLFIVTLAGFGGLPEMQSLSPNAWSLAVEIFCYFLLAVFFAKSKVAPERFRTATKSARLRSQELHTTPLYSFYCIDAAQRWNSRRKAVAGYRY